jgi:hypothetical protein
MDAETVSCFGLMDDFQCKMMTSEVMAFALA